MDHAVTLARHFARLIWLLLDDAGNVDEQKAQLRAIVTIAKDGGAAFDAGADSISANGTPLAAVLSGVHEMASQMAAHGIATITVDAGATAADVLGAARALAAAPGSAPVTAPGPSVRFAPREMPPPSPAAIPTLIDQLGDPRWQVARNAATQLGEMQAAGAERPLGTLLNHDDERVRHAAIGSLMRLGTPRSMQAIQEAFKDKAPQIRMQAAAVLVTRTDVRTAALLLRALDDEQDDEVAAAFLIALGRLATGDAVDRLIATAEADRGIFRKKPVALRVAAVQGLSEAGTPEALATLKALQSDKDEDVRATAVYALGRATRSARR